MRAEHLFGLFLSMLVIFGASAPVSGAVTIIPTEPAQNAGLSDGRAYEQVSPVDKNGSEAAATSTPSVYYALAAGDGESVMFGGTGPFGETVSGSDSLSVAKRVAGVGWSTRGIIPAGQGIDSNNIFAERQTNVMAASDFSRFAFTAPGSFVPQNPVFGTGTSSTSMYEVDSKWGLTWLTEPAIADPIPEPGHFEVGFAMLFAGASPNLDTVYFTDFGTLVPEDASRSPHVSASTEAGPWGFYEWHAGTLKSAAGLPNGEFDPYGALPAGEMSKGPGASLISSDGFNNQVSQDGSKAFFVSPDFETAHPAGDPVELYLHERGQANGVLVSRDELEGGKPAPGYEEGAGATGVTPVGNLTPRQQRLFSFVYAAPDGSRAFFESQDKLARSAAGAEPTGSGPWMYEFDLASDKVSYLPGVSGPILASSTDGSRFIFVQLGASNQLDAWIDGSLRKLSGFEAPSDLAFAPARATNDGSAFVWETNAELDPGSFNNGGDHDQVYRYDVAEDALTCVSCPPAGTAPSGDAHLSNDDQQTGSPEETFSEAEVYGSRGIAADASQVFFDSPDALVSEDVNGARDVYEWENGRVSLISSGQDQFGSFFLDNSESGNDVFFATADGLNKVDEDKVFDVYDARVDGGFPVSNAGASLCTSDCQNEPVPPAPFTTPVSAAFTGAGNPASAHAPTKAGTGKKKTAKKRKHSKKRAKRKGKKRSKKADAGGKRGGRA